MTLREKIIISAFCALLLSPGCTTGEPDLEEIILELSSGGAYGVGVRTLTFIDPTRETPSHSGIPAEPTRTFPTEIWYPSPGENQNPSREAPLDLAPGPYPLIIFSHGFMATGTIYSRLTAPLAGHGYVVAAPNYPVSSPATGGFGMDLASHPDDVSFLIDSLIALSRENGGWLSGGIEEDSIGLAGHSLGGAITVMTTFGPLADPRIKAAAPLSPFACFLDDPYYQSGGAPILFIGGERDIFTRFSSNLLRPYTLAPAPKYLVEIAGGTHIGFVDLPNIPETSAFFQVFYSMEIDPALLSGFTELMAVTEGSFSHCLDMFASTEELEAIPQLDADRQREIARVLLPGFFHLYLKGEEKYRVLFREELGSLFPEVSMRWEEE